MKQVFFAKQGIHPTTFHHNSRNAQQSSSTPKSILHLTSKNHNRSQCYQNRPKSSQIHPNSMARLTNWVAINNLIDREKVLPAEGGKVRGGHIFCQQRKKTKTKTKTRRRCQKLIARKSKRNTNGLEKLDLLFLVWRSE